MFTSWVPVFEIIEARAVSGLFGKVKAQENAITAFTMRESVLEELKANQMPSVNDKPQEASAQG